MAKEMYQVFCINICPRSHGAREGSQLSATQRSDLKLINHNSYYPVGQDRHAPSNESIHYEASKHLPFLGIIGHWLQPGLTVSIFKHTTHPDYSLIDPPCFFWFVCDYFLARTRITSSIFAFLLRRYLTTYTGEIDPVDIFKIASHGSRVKPERSDIVCKVSKKDPVTTKRILDNCTPISPSLSTHIDPIGYISLLNPVELEKPDYTGSWIISVWDPDPSAWTIAAEIWDQSKAGFDAEKIADAVLLLFEHPEEEDDLAQPNNLNPETGPLHDSETSSALRRSGANTSNLLNAPPHIQQKRTCLAASLRFCNSLKEDLGGRATQIFQLKASPLEAFSFVQSSGTLNNDNKTFPEGRQLVA
ncbi:hypothetical protein VP01_1549g1 [Puccinia sorghi]|uniref:Uncharacterized protein n=1 Tax=Puccinia sorghi TaxID=27349 RepID=A0A0L6VK21_9BASI|nr:hypothetical protein VP01_1549g1 [Puccinia sorghi]